jgi:hypothetical protein
MKRLWYAISGVYLIGLLGGGATILAHHAFMAEYDAEQIVNLKGVVTRFEWANPHCHVFIEVKDAEGTATLWDFEMGGPGILVQNGWEKTTLHSGDIVSVRAALARNGTKKASAREVTLPNGKRLSGASPVDGGPQ